MRILEYTISLILIVYSLNASAQVDSIATDSSRVNKFKPTGVRVGLDLVSLGQGVVDKGLSAITQADVRQWKISADIDFYRYFLNIEYGIFERQWNGPNDASIYQNEGNFFKIGPDINFLHRDPDQSALFFGIRYAQANYEDRLVYDYTSDFWGNGTESLENSTLTSRWYELTTGLKVKLYKFIWSGYTARFKFSVNDNYSNNELAPLWIPGFGRATEESRWGFEYWIIFKIPFREYTPAPKRKD
ncbi:DUF6048 family protein [Fulvivirga lutea]|uniref:DUF3575 domain-containing protein n=1 Tax=Fulvivirga lutea TaxID=2810512 RepID=A0A974WGK1_9BACT|nr:DUF6048 family protein [Fulvivirga lutea]QSE97906.1 hypothetical protein JR347_02125 [Fulvivirga lutea]